MLLKLVPREFSLAWGRGGKSPWERGWSVRTFVFKSWKQFDMIFELARGRKFSGEQ